MASTDRDSLNIILLNGGIAKHYADWNWKGVQSPYARLFFPMEGSAKVIIGDTVHALMPGHLYLIPPFTIHGYECSEYFSHSYFHIYESPASKVRALEEFDFPFEIRASELDKLLVGRLLEINPDRELKKYDPASYDNESGLLRNISTDIRNPYYLSVENNGILSMLFSRFLEGAIRKYEYTDSRLRDVLKFIRRNIDKHITTAQLSEICHVTSDHLIRMFRKELSCTPMQYILQKKVEKAQLLLITGRSSVQDIAYSLSFNNVSYFNRVFKNLAGTTPNKYRNSVYSGRGEDRI